MFLQCCQDCLKMKKSWKKRVSGCYSVDVKTMKVLQNFRICVRVDYCGTTTAVLSQNGIWHVHFFFNLKYLRNPLFYIPSICSNRFCFKVQMTLGVQLGFDNQWIVCSNLRRIWIILLNLCHFKHKTGFLSYISNLDGPWNTEHNTFQGYPHMDRCIGCHTCAFTVAYAALWLEVLLHYSAVKVFHIRCVTRGNEGEANPSISLEIKKMPWFWKKGPDFVRSEVKFIIQNIVLRIYILG